MTTEAGYDGHINRNIRLAMAMIDMTKPYIMVDRILSIKIDGEDFLQIEFKLNGCVSIEEVSYHLNGVKELIDSTDSYCNHLVPDGEEQTIFNLKVLPTDEVVLNAVVDQDWCESVDSSSVGPVGFADDPQTHFVRLRMDNVYDVENKGKFIKADRVLRFDVTEFLPLAHEYGELNAAQVLDI